MTVTPLSSSGNTQPPKKARRTKAQMERARKKAIAARKHHLKKQHKMTPETYKKIKDWQSGVCPLCLRANGASKALAVDHDHAHCSGTSSCPECWRGLCCSVCNGILAHCRDDILMLQRFIEYLKTPPAQEWRKHMQKITGHWPDE